MMYAPRVFISMIGALVVFAVVTYAMTGSAWTTFIQTAICAVLIQIGYFLATLVLVWRAARDRKRDAGGALDARKSEDASPNLSVSRLDKRGHSNF